MVDCITSRDSMVKVAGVLLEAVDNPEERKTSSTLTGMASRLDICPKSVNLSLMSLQETGAIELCRSRVAIRDLTLLHRIAESAS
jgi:hypothetical protein